MESAKLTNDAIPINIFVAGLLAKDMLLVANENSVWNYIGYWRDLMAFKILVNNNEYEIQLVRKTQNLIEFKLGNKVFLLTQWKINNKTITFNINNTDYSIYHSENNRGEHFITYKGVTHTLKRNDVLVSGETYDSSASGNGEDANQIFSPMPGKVVKINVKVGDTIAKGDNLIIVEAMKMENQIKAHKDAVINKINVNVNDKVTSSNPLIIFEE